MSGIAGIINFFSKSFLNRPKMGFGMPIVDLCRNSFRWIIEEELRNPRNVVYKFVDFWFCKEILDFFI